MANLERTSWVAGIVGAVLSAVALAWGVWVYIRPAEAQPPQKQASLATVSGVQSIGGGNNTQIGAVAGNVTIITTPLTTQTPAPTIAKAKSEPVVVQSTQPPPAKPGEAEVSDFSRGEREADSYACVQRLLLKPSAATYGFQLEVPSPSRFVHFPLEPNRVLSTKMLDPANVEVKVSASTGGGNTFVCVLR